MSSRNRVNEDRDFTLELRLGMKLTFITPKIKIVCKIGSVIHVLKTYTNAKMRETAETSSNHE